MRKNKGNRKSSLGVHQVNNCLRQYPPPKGVQIDGWSSEEEQDMKVVQVFSQATCQLRKKK